MSAAGLSVWWDTAIEGGSSFAKDIARELDAADVVVVVWSVTAVDSVWVLDEAGAGRDRGRLVPVQIDGTQPPLGFRQLQAIDLSNWKGRASDPKITALVAAVAHVAGSSPPPAAMAKKRSALRFTPWLVAALLLIAALGAGWHFFGPKIGEPSRPVVAVLPFTDMSEARGKAYFAEGLAEEVLDTLAHDARLKVLGGTTARAIRDNSADPDFARDKLGVTRLLEGSVRGGGGSNNIKVSVRLIDTADGSEIWSQVFERSGTDVAAVQEEVAQAVAVELSGSLGSGLKSAATAAEVPAAVYQKLVVARQLLRTRQYDSILRARALADEAVALAPGYAAAHATQSRAMTLAIAYAGAPASGAADAGRAAQTAIKLDPALAEGYLATGIIASNEGRSREAIQALARAVALQPEDAEAQMQLGRAYRDAGDFKRAIPAFEHAVAKDPLWYVAVTNLAQVYEMAGQFDKARAVARNFRGLTPNPVEADLLDSHVALYSGEPARALAFADAALKRNPNLSGARDTRMIVLSQALFAADRMTPVDWVTMPPSGQAELQGRWADLVETSGRRGNALWAEKDSLASTTYALNKLHRQAELVGAFDARYATVNAFVTSDLASSQSALNLAAAFDAAGRHQDARTLRKSARAEMQFAAANGVPPGAIARSWAVLALQEGDRAGALAKLEAGISASWWEVCQFPWLGDDWRFAPLYGDPRFEAVKTRCRTEINKQRTLAGIAPAVLK